jgi:hypothetical protein
MRLVWLAQFGLGLVSLTLISCSNRHDLRKAVTTSKAHLERKNGRSKITMRGIVKSKAVELAKEEFIKNGRIAEDYHVTVENSRRQWVVWFDYKGEYPIPGGQDAVTVEKDTGKVAFLPGE